MKTPLVSILLPTHNRADVLACAIGSVLYQTETDFELLVVADGCTDQSAQLVRSFSDHRIRLYDLAKGPGYGYANRNLALRESRGEFIAYMTHDDLWLPDHLARCLSEFCSDLRDTDSIDLVYSKPLWVAADGTIYPQTFNLHSPSIYSYFVNGQFSAIYACCLMHRRRVFEEVGYWDENLEKNADWDMWSRILKNKEPCFRMHREYTSMHFHANWKTAEQVPTAYAHWRSFYATLGQDLPEKLALPLPDDKPEQHVYWHLLHEAPESFSESLRQDLQSVLDLRVHNSN